MGRGGKRRWRSGRAGEGGSEEARCGMRGISGDLASHSVSKWMANIPGDNSKGIKAAM